MLLVQLPVGTEETLPILSDHVRVQTTVETPLEAGHSPHHPQEHRHPISTMLLRPLGKLALDDHAVLCPVVVVIDVQPELVRVLVAYGPLIKLEIRVFSLDLLQSAPHLVASPVQPAPTKAPVRVHRIPGLYAHIRGLVFFVLGDQRTTGIPTAQTDHR